MNKEDQEKLRRLDAESVYRRQQEKPTPDNNDLVVGHTVCTDHTDNTNPKQIYIVPPDYKWCYNYLRAIAAALGCNVREVREKLRWFGANARSVITVPEIKYDEFLLIKSVLAAGGEDAKG